MTSVHTVTVLHRLVIAFAASSLLVLALFRRLFPPALAWLGAAWWAVLPTNFNTCYEVHLFALLPALVSWLVLLSWRGRWGRGVALGILAASVVLMRNEMSVATILFGAACAVGEWRRGARSGEGVPDARWCDLLRPPTAPTSPSHCCSACAFLVYRSGQNAAELRTGMSLKHTLNMSQVYTFSYEQRHPEYTRDPWGDYQELMTRQFGEPLLPLSTMLQRNPGAVLWNTSGGTGSSFRSGWRCCSSTAPPGSRPLAPDYPLWSTRRPGRSILLVLLVCCWLAGAKARGAGVAVLVGDVEQRHGCVGLGRNAGGGRRHDTGHHDPAPAPVVPVRPECVPHGRHVHVRVGADAPLGASGPVPGRGGCP